jgi:hypothetical protein
MLRTKSTLFTLSAVPAFLLLSACGGEAPTESGTSSDTAASSPSEVTSTVQEQTQTASSSAIDYISREELKGMKGKDCELLTLQDVSKVAGTDETKISSMSILGCQYSWDKANAEDIEAKNQEIVSKGMAEGLSFVEIGKRQMPSENTVSLYVDTYSAPQNQGMLDVQYRSLTNMLSDEEKARNAAALKKAFEQVSAGEGGSKPLDETEKSIAGSLIGVIEKEAQNETYEAVDGIGVRAAWSDYANKLVVQHRNMFFTLNVDTGDDQSDLKLAKTLAASVVERLDDSL